MKKQKPLKPRNGHALNPLMRKGGVHEKSHKAKRAQARRALQKDLQRLPSFCMTDMPHAA